MTFVYNAVMKNKNIKLNCDMGESFGIYSLGLDEYIMPHIDMANLACGYHASDPVTMHKSIRSALEHGVEIGAHPSYPDLVGFGRRDMHCSTEEIVSFVLYQLGALEALCRSYDTRVTYLKPHGALYNAMMRDETVFRAIAKAISKYDPVIRLMVLSSGKNAHYAKLAGKYGISLLYEVFADRRYGSDGSLVPRSEENAVIIDSTEVLRRVRLLLDEGVIETVEGKRLPIEADTICVHGDNAHALELTKLIAKLRDESQSR